MEALEMRSYGSLIAMVGLLCILGVQAQGAPIPGLYNTGLAAEGQPDPHYSLTGTPNPVAAYVVFSDGFPFYDQQGAHYWMDNTPGVSSWIAPQNDYRAIGTDLPDVSYIFFTTFVLPAGYNPATAMITGRWSTDNQGVSITLNSTNTGNSISDIHSYLAWHNFSITSGFIAGLNTLYFEVYNTSGPVNPSGLRVEILDSDMEELIPEPGTFALLGVGLLGLVLVRRRMKRA
jgi:hypothetical protein